MQTGSRHGSTLDYLISVPDNHRQGTSLPVVFCLHGFGADMHDLTGLAPVLGTTGYVFVFPNAPFTLDLGGGFTGRAWHERGGNERDDTVRESLNALDGVVREGMAEFAPGHQAVMLGFSQGGAMTYRYGLPRPEQFAGLAVLSGSLRKTKDLLPILPGDRSQPLYIAHGTEDPLVPVAWARESVTFLRGQGYQPVYQEFSGGHTIPPVLLDDLVPWLRSTLPPADSHPA